jgi:hypothetical protein
MRSWLRVPAFFRAGQRIEKQITATDGIVGYSLGAHLPAFCSIRSQSGRTKHRCANSHAVCSTATRCASSTTICVCQAHSYVGRCAELRCH